MWPSVRKTGKRSPPNQFLSAIDDPAVKQKWSWRRGGPWLRIQSHRNLQGGLVNHEGLHQGLAQTLVYLQVIHSTSHYTTGLFFLLSFLSQTTTQIHNFGMQTRKNNTHLWSLFIFSGHSTRKLASSRMTYFILGAYTGTSVSHS